MQAERWWRRVRGQWFERHYLPRIMKRTSFWSDVGAENDLVIRTFADHRIVFHPADAFIGHEILVRGHWQRPVTERAISLLDERGLLKSGGVFVDVGANIGTQSIYAWLTGKFGRIVAVEPSPAEFEMLQLNMQLNGLSEVSRCHPIAADAKAGPVTLRLNSVNRGDNRLVEDAADGVPVQARPLDDVLAEDGIAPDDVSLVWIDVQGHEPQAVAGMARTIASGLPMVIEFNREWYGEERTTAFISALEMTHDGFIDLRKETGAVQPLRDLASVQGESDVLVFRK
ncbi:FkbM family methyltransferase [Tepidamorphus sp. 3E244]|uniref:FkbM family methyltransferase n=1 Tax=Tepidamorphus sp. 3E244 TaxID=3385498 RepID=UPI0038FCB730